MKRIFLALFALLAIGSAFAQTKFPLTIICNVMDADVYINNKPYTRTTPNLVIQLPPNTFNIKVAKAGFSDFNANVTVARSGTTLNVNLQPLGAAPAQVAPAQTLLPSFPLNITSNAGAAQVFLNGNLAGATPFGANVIGGTYEIRVTAPGYQDFFQRMNVRSPTTVNAQLQSLGSQLSVNSNVNGASVLINGNPAGQTPFSGTMPNGSYTVVVRAPGYMDFSQNIVINGGPLQVNAMLQGQNQQLSVQCNVNGADVYINGNPAGKTPLGAQVPQGSYTIQVKAPGFSDFSQNVVVGNGPAMVNAFLQPMLATWQLRLPETMRNKDSKSRDSIQIWIDGAPQNVVQGPIMAAGQLTPGRHVVRLAAGGLFSETQVDVQVGQAYTFEPFIGISVK